MRWRQRLRAQWVALATVVAVAGCASIPHSGPVSEAPGGEGLGQSTVRYSPALPTEGASPSDIVRGYLDAMLAYPMSTRAAAAFLTPAAAEQWRPQSGVTIYNTPSVSQPANGPSRGDGSGETERVTVQLDEQGRLGATGNYSVGRGEHIIGYDLVRVDGQWRIADPQDGLMITEKFFDDYFRTFSLYFFDRPARRLTAVPVHLPVDDRLAAALMAGLAKGPVEDGHRTFLPPAANLRPTVPVTDGIADVGFTGVDRHEIDADRLSAQLAWTLRQVPSLGGVRLTVDDQPLTGSEILAPVTTGEQYQVTESLASAFGLRDDRVVRLADGQVSAIDGPWGADAGGARAVAVGTEDIAVLTRDRRSVRVATLEGDEQVTVDGVGLLPPVVDADGRFWVVDRPDGRTRVRVIDGRQVAPIEAPALESMRIGSFDVSPDGSRYLVGARSDDSTTLQVGRIARSADDQIVGLREPSQPYRQGGDVESPVWTSAVQISFLTSEREISAVLVDGSDANRTAVRTVLPGGALARVTFSSRGDGVGYLTTADGALWHLGASGRWQPVSSIEPIHSVSFGP